MQRFRNGCANASAHAAAPHPHGVRVRSGTLERTAGVQPPAPPPRPHTWFAANVTHYIDASSPVDVDSVRANTPPRPPPQRSLQSQASRSSQNLQLPAATAAAAAAAATPLPLPSFTAVVIAPGACAQCAAEPLPTSL